MTEPTTKANERLHELAAEATALGGRLISVEREDRTTYPAR